MKIMISLSISLPTRISSSTIKGFFFIFGVLHPVARILSRLLEEPSLARTFQDVYFILYIFCRYMFRPLLAIFRRNTQPDYFTELLHPQLIRSFVLLGYIYSTCLPNTAVVHFICVCELLKLGQITSLLNVKTLKC
jgi:hypothetical protein